jgi:hypothetical protein
MDKNSRDEQLIIDFNSKEKDNVVEVKRDIIFFKENKDTTYDVILLLQGFEFAGNKYTPVTNKKLLCTIEADQLDMMYALYAKCNDNICVEAL